MNHFEKLLYILNAQLEECTSPEYKGTSRKSTGHRISSIKRDIRKVTEVMQKTQSQKNQLN